MNKKSFLAPKIPIEKKKFEHKVLKVDDNLEEILCKLGQEGFRVVATVTGGISNVQRIILERETE